MTTPNIIFIVLDTLRADKVLASKNNIVLTPFLKKLKNHSIYFENCVANCAWTLPSHISMFTGLYSTENKIITNEVSKLSKRTPVLTEILKNLGYSTFCYSENPWISIYTGLTRGFDTVYKAWKKNIWYEETYKFSQFLKNLKKIDSYIKKKLKNKFILYLWALLFHKLDNIFKSLSIQLFPDDIIFKLKNRNIQDLENFGRILKNHSKSRPNYIFFNLMTTHDPYIPLKRDFNSFNIKLKFFRKIKKMIVSPIRYRLKINIGSQKFSEKIINITNNLYNACVHSCDSIIKKLFGLFQSLDLLENSYVIIASDHGEHLGSKLDHYLWEHSTYLSLYESIIKVPLLIYNSKFTERTIEEQVQLKDLFHTILHLTGIPQSQNTYLDLNKSIIYQIEKNTTPKYIIGEFLKNKKRLHDILYEYRRVLNKKLIPKIKNDIFYLRSNKFKVIKYNNIENDEFYDLSEDPFEQNNLYNQNNEIYGKLKKKFDEILKEIGNLEKLKKYITTEEKSIVKRIVNKIKMD